MTDIIVVHKDVLCLIKHFLKYLKRNTAMPFRLIVVDNSSSDCSVEFLQKEKDLGNIDVLVRASKEKVPQFLPHRTDLIYDRYFGELTHGDCLDIASEYIINKFYVTIDSDVFVKQGWLSRLLIEMEDNSVCSTGYSKYGVANTSRIWVACCLTRSEMYFRHRCSFRPVSCGELYYDTGDYLSTVLNKENKHIHIKGHKEYWNHIVGMTSFHNILKSYKTIDEIIKRNILPKDIMRSASEWYYKLFEIYDTADCDCEWFLDSHLELIKKLN